MSRRLFLLLSLFAAIAALLLAAALRGRPTLCYPVGAVLICEPRRQ